MDTGSEEVKERMLCDEQQRRSGVVTHRLSANDMCCLVWIAQSLGARSEGWNARGW